MKNIAARRELLFSSKGESTRLRFAVRITVPEEVQQSEVNFECSPGTSRCTINFDGLPEPDIDVFGADSIQALNLASDIDPYLRGLSKKYDFFFDSGEEYFDD